MTEPRLAILGSCVTRDLFGMSPDPIIRETPLLFIARSSLAGLFTSAPETMPEPRPCNELDRFEGRALKADLAKINVGRLIEYQPTHIVVDFIDDRYDLITFGETVSLFTAAMRAGGIHEAFPEHRIVCRMSAEADALWTRGLNKFAAFCRNKLPDTKIILHRATWATSYIDEAGTAHPFADNWSIWDKRETSIAAQNAMIRRYQWAFVHAFPQALTLDPAPYMKRASARHRWGLAPFHYLPAYYECVREQLLAHIGAGRSRGFQPPAWGGSEGTGEVLRRAAEAQGLNQAA